MSGKIFSLGSRFISTEGRPSGFDFLRLCLALAVLCVHVPEAAYGRLFVEEFQKSNWRFLIMPILPMFFALSGFLVAGSLMRCRKITSFLALRVLRILPALAVEVFISALLVGPIFTVFSLSDYLRGWEFRQYFLNILGEVHYFLPGVFIATPIPKGVNLQLWTIPFELACYLLLTCLALLNARRCRFLVPAAAACLSIVLIIQNMRVPGGVRVDFFETEGDFLILGFLWGVSLFIYQDRVPFSGRLFFAFVTLSFWALWIGGVYLYAAPLTLAYVTVWLGLTNFRRPLILYSADYSYGIYLYHWVIFQVVLSLSSKSWYTTAFIGVPATLLVAALSWHLVEKRVLKFRHEVHSFDEGNSSPWMIKSSVAFAVAAGFVLCLKFYYLINPVPLNSRVTMIVSQAKQNAGMIKTVFLGDDLVETANTQACGQNAFNAGVSGAKLSDLLHLSRQLFAILRPERVVIMIGLHDTSAKIRFDPWTFETMYHELIALSRQSGSVVQIGTIVTPPLARNSDFFVSGYAEVLNKIIRDLSTMEHIELADFAKRLSDLDFEQASASGIGLTTAGYTNWRGVLHAACPNATPLSGP